MEYSICNFVGHSPARYKNGWIKTSEALSLTLTNCAWSPCVWKNSERSKANFDFADLLAFDFDGTWTLQQCIDYVRLINAWCVIGITKSHQPDSHRFRLVLHWNKRINDLTVFEKNLSRFIDTLPADPACRDGGRFFYPCTKIIYQQNGIFIPVLDVETKKTRPQKRYYASSKTHDVPPWMANELATGIPDGSRNRTAFRFALHLKDRGLDKDKTVDILSSITLPENELRRTVASAWNYKLHGSRR
ncbi:MAG TPA: primase C-terminal domain-containing protein [Desulfosporosinus sp.]|nr:primase C-terminal domain-containing protein [Desulfosporosinus sp.]